MPSQTPAPGTLHLDHVGHFVPDLESAAQVLENAGFVLTPFTRQQNRIGDELLPSGTSNRCIMLQEGYLEFLTNTDDTPLAQQLMDALSRYTGLHLIAIASADAEASHATLVDGGFNPLPPVHLTRPVKDAEGVEHEARFTVLRVPPGTMPEGRMQLLQHHTPELAWQPRWQSHSNGVTSLIATLLCVPDPQEAAERFARFTGVACQRAADSNAAGGQAAGRQGDGMQATDMQANDRQGEDRWVLPLARGALVFVSPDGLKKIAPFAVETAAPAAPWIVATALGSSDPKLTGACFDRAGIQALTDTSPDRRQQQSYRLPDSVGSFFTVVQAGEAPDWLV